ncbi:carnitine O-palmitoyltransferase 1, liver isoform isoform X3 [Anthonomus grandis grandis]|uniref:carnitine O-palmitoyltransferase 1, liver isoform isoform X3 n=1 Tax=Anthonomus grandis grandis TaxID=2921223 RepID=UPI0021667035|nr:carnitine O-palmitoyltransferase 1, liver isoform isoform X3 [Anthonomus grandis grandis]
MAEAHAAVAFSFSITHEGWDVNLDREVLNLVWQSGVRSWKKRIARLLNNVHNGVYPGHYSYLCVIIGIVSAMQLNGMRPPFNLPNKILSVCPSNSLYWQLGACTISSLSYWLPAVYFLRYSLKVLFMYKGWMYEAKGKYTKPSLKTKLWLGLVKVLGGWNTPKLYSYQSSLPRLPLPSLHDTMTRYLKSVRPLLDDKSHAKMVLLAEEFKNGIGKKLQRYLLLKSWWATNYVSDWWEEYVYLRGRYPLMINSNFYGIDAIMLHPTTNQAARAGSIINSLLMFRRLLDRQELDPILIQGLVPLCSWQYERIFNTTRIPGEEADKIVHVRDSTHIAVYHKGRYFKVIIYHRGRILRPAEIQMQIEQILKDESPPQPGEEKLAALTAGLRSHWAWTRDTYFSKGINRTSLDAIEKAAFVVVLDDFPYEFDMDDPSKLDQYGKVLLHGRGYDRWFDKSFTLCIGNNGRLGFNAEHSWSDAPILAHCLEYILLEEAENPRFDHNGNTLGNPEFTPPPPSRLNWDIKRECQGAIQASLDIANKLIEDIDLRIYVHNKYGKGFMKGCGLSPDAYIQMALQLAYYRDAGKFCLTYEATMTRLFREGRTETVRPCTVESSQWVKAMENNDIALEEKVRLLRVACETHQRAVKDAMTGKGIDRHIFCLYVVSKYLDVDSPFLKEVLSEPWRLSTSQTPHGQTKRMDLTRHPKCISAGGGFGPVADDGYGVSYIIAGEGLLFFHISNKKSCPTTDCHRFAKQIEKALEDLHELHTQYNLLTKK